MKNLKLKPFSLLIFAVFAVCFILIALIGKKDVVDIWSALQVAYKTIPILLLLGSGFVLYGWKWRIFRFKNWLVSFPDLNGTWEGTIQTTWKNPETGEVPGPIPVILTIKQSFIRISCVMRTAEMTSRSFLADFWLDGDEQIRMLGYCYQSVPLPSVRERSQSHDGTIVFEIIGQTNNKLKGRYWTDRKMTGEVNLTFRDKHRSDEVPGDFDRHPVSGK